MIMIIMMMMMMKTMRRKIMILVDDGESHSTALSWRSWWVFPYLYHLILFMWRKRAFAFYFSLHVIHVPMSHSKRQRKSSDIELHFSTFQKFENYLFLHRSVVGNFILVMNWKKRTDVTLSSLFPQYSHGHCANTADDAINRVAKANSCSIWNENKGNKRLWDHIG